jgi:thymidylate synthase
MASYEQQYLALIRSVWKTGLVRQDRTGVGTFSVFAPPQLDIDLRDGFPLLTVRKMGWKLVIKELLWFLRGQTDNKLLQAQGVHIWDGNTSRGFLDSLGLNHLREGDGGAIYGHQWRHWGAPYVDCETDYSGQGFDQVAHVERLIRESPDSRRIILSGWDPRQFGSQVLPACHAFAQFYVSEEFLDCLLYIRSSDTVLGLPTNVSSYAALSMLFAKRAGLTARRLVVAHRL